MNTNKMKKLLLEQLQKTPVIQIACEKVGVARPTYYVWRNKDAKFAAAADKAVADGLMLINDLAETQLISAIKDRNMTGIMYWLRHRHPAYAERLQINAQLQDQLTPEQEKLLRQAIQLTGLIQEESGNKNNHENHTKET